MQMSIAEIIIIIIPIYLNTLNFSGSCSRYKYASETIF